MKSKITIIQNAILLFYAIIIAGIAALWLSNMNSTEERNVIRATEVERIPYSASALDSVHFTWFYNSNTAGFANAAETLDVADEDTIYVARYDDSFDKIRYIISAMKSGESVESVTIRDSTGAHCERFILHIDSIPCVCRHFNAYDYASPESRITEVLRAVIKGGFIRDISYIEAL